MRDIDTNHGSHHVIHAGNHRMDGTDQQGGTERGACVGSLHDDTGLREDGERREGENGPEDHPRHEDRGERGTARALRDMPIRIPGLMTLGILGIGISAYGFLAGDDHVILVGLCIVLGLDVKLMDQLIDDPAMKRYRRLAFPLAVPIPLLMGYLATIHDPVFGMVMGTALGLLISGKLDHPAFIMAAVGFVVAMAVFVLAFDIGIAATSYTLIPVAALAGAGDEIGHERTWGGARSRRIRWIFDHRPLLKVVAVISVLIGFADPIHLAGFLCWDLSYDAVAFLWGWDKKAK